MYPCIAKYRHVLPSTAMYCRVGSNRAMYSHILLCIATFIDVVPYAAYQINEFGYSQFLWVTAIWFSIYYSPFMNTLHEFLNFAWLICIPSVEPPPWRHYRVVIAVVWIQHTTVIIQYAFGWLKVWRSVRCRDSFCFWWYNRPFGGSGHKVLN